MRRGNSEGTPRIVSLIASATEIVYALKLERFLVGRSHECDYPAEVLQLPCCSKTRFDCSGSSAEIDRLVKQSVAEAISVYAVLDEVLEALQPTHILTQTQCEVCAVSLRDVELSVAKRLSSQPRIIALEPHSLDDIWQDMRRVAEGCDVDAEAVISELQERMRALSELARSEARLPRVACIEWVEPLMAAGNWVPELVEMANGINLFGTVGRHSPSMTWEQLVEADPDVIVVMPCGFPIDRTESEMHWLTDRPDYHKLRAVRDGEVYVADGNQYFNRPGPRVVESLEILIEILHPTLKDRERFGSGFVRFERASSFS